MAQGQIGCANDAASSGRLLHRHQCFGCQRHARPSIGMNEPQTAAISGTVRSAKEWAGMPQDDHQLVMILDETPWRTPVQEAWHQD